MSTARWFVSVALVVAAYAPAQAQTVRTSPFVSNPTNVNDFQTIGGPYFPTKTTYTKGGVDVRYNGSASCGDNIWTERSETYSWYVCGGGYGFTSISLTGGGAFSAIDFLAGNGWSSTNVNLVYQLMLSGASVATGNAGAMSDNRSTFGFDGLLMDEVRLQAIYDGSNASFNPTQYEALDLDNIRIDAVVASPEPATITLLLTGLGLIATVRRRRQTAE